MTYSYNNGRLRSGLTLQQPTGSWTNGFLYDAARRLTSTIAGTDPFSDEIRYLYEGMRVIQERNSGNTPTVAYLRGSDLSGSLEGAGGTGGLLARSHGYSSGSLTNQNYYHADGGGNVTYMVNNSQSSVASYKYDPYGNTISSSGSLASANVYRFSSKEIHVSSGLYYYGYRFYDPNLQRWLNRDPLGEAGFETLRRGAADVAGDGPNLYAFVRNNPIARTDLFGLAIWKCSRNTGWGWDGDLQHAYLWDDRAYVFGKRSCGRDGAIKGKGVSNPLDKGPGIDKCVKVPNSEGKENTVMGCCKTPRWKPFPIGDCHEWAENCLEKNGLEDPYIYGRYRGPEDKFYEWWGRQIQVQFP